MKIAVCVKHVPDGRERLDAATKRLDRSGAGELNKFDTNAVEEALQLKERLGGEVVVLSMGPPGASETLRTALALGADRAVLVTDAAAVGADLLATSAVLAAALARETPDVVLFGQQTSDGGGAVLWAAVADLLQAPVVSQVTELAATETSLRCVRQTEFGDDVIETTLPAVVAVTDAINEPRYASLKGMMGAKKKPLDTVSLADLGLDPSRGGEDGSMTTVRSFSDPPTRANISRVDDEANAAQAIISFLVERELV